MDKHKRKYQNTAEKMYHALIDLMEKKTFEEITIKELCERANINRSTFYSHYQNMAELLRDTKRYIVNLFSERIESQGVSIQMEGGLSDRFLRVYIQLYKEYRNIFLIPTFRPGILYLGKEIMEEYEMLFYSFFQEIGITDKKKIRYIISYCDAGVHEIIMRWLENGCQEEVEDICDIIQTCIFR